MRINRIFNLAILAVLLISFLGYLRIYKSWGQQITLITDMNNDSFSGSQSWDFIENIETEFPNLTVTAVPLEAIKAQYYLYNDSVVKGMEMIDNVIRKRSNPYIMLPEALKAKYYNTIGQLDSAKFYSKKAFNGLPKNPFHFVELNRSFVQNNQIDSIVPYFKKVRYPFQQDIYRLFLSTVLPHLEKFDEETNKFIKDVAIEGIKKSANSADQYNNLLRLTSFMILYGKDSVEQMLEIEKEASSLLNDKKYLESLDLYFKLNELIPTNYIFKENIALASFNLKDFDTSAKMYYEVEDLNHNLTESQQFIMGISLWNTNSKSLGCERIMIASELGVEEANNALKILCGL